MTKEEIKKEEEKIGNRFYRLDELCEYSLRLRRLQDGDTTDVK